MKSNLIKDNYVGFENNNLKEFAEKYGINIPKKILLKK